MLNFTQFKSFTDMASEEALQHWMDPLSPELVSRLGIIVLELHRLSLCSKIIKNNFDLVQKQSENQIGIGHFVNDKLAFKLALELKTYNSFENADWFLRERHIRVGEDHFGSLLNLALLHEVGCQLSSAFELETDLLDLANKENDPIKQLLAVVMIGKNQEQRGNIEEARSVYENLPYLIRRVEKLSLKSPLCDERRYYYSLSCRELEFFHRLKQDKNFTIQYLEKSLLLIGENSRDLGFSVQTHLFLLGTYKHPEEYASIENACQDIISKMEFVLENYSSDTFELKYGKMLRCAYVQLSVSLKVCHSLMNLGEKLFGIHRTLLGVHHDEVMLIASYLANQCFSLGNMALTVQYLEIAQAGFKRHVTTDLKSVTQNKIVTAKNLSMIFHNQNLLEDAVFWRKEELRLNEEYHGRKSKYASNSWVSLAFLLHLQGNIDEEINCLEKGLEICLMAEPNFYSRHERLKIKLDLALAARHRKNIFSRRPVLR